MTQQEHIKARILEQLRWEEKTLMGMRERLERINSNNTKNVELQRQKLIGMIEVAKICDVDTREFHWIYNI